MYSGAEEQRSRREEGLERVHPEGAEQDQELADETAGPGQPNRGQHEAP